MQFLHRIAHLGHTHALTFAHECTLRRLVGLDFIGQNAMAAFGGTLGKTYCFLGIFLLFRFRTRQRCLGSGAGHIAAKLAACQVGHFLGHQAIGHHLATGNGDKTAHAVAALVVQAHNAAADAAPAGVAVGGHQWPHAGISSQNTRGGQRRGQFLALGEQHLHFFVGDTHVVDGFHRHTVAGGTNHAHGIVGNQNIGVGWLAAAVNHHVVHSMAENQQRSLGGEHIDFDAGHGSYALPPDAGGIDGDVAAHLGTLASELVQQFHSFHTALIDNQALHLMVSEAVCAVQARIVHVGHRQAEWVD